MKIFKLFLLPIALVFIGQAQAVGWNDLKPYEVTDATPIVFSPKANTLVLEDTEGTLTVEQVLKRKDEFKPPSEMAPLDTRHHYWIMQRSAANWRLIKTSDLKEIGKVSIPMSSSR